MFSVGVIVVGEVGPGRVALEVPATAAERAAIARLFAVKRGRALDELLSGFRCEKPECDNSSSAESRPAPRLRRQDHVMFCETVQVRCRICGVPRLAELWY